MKDNSLRNEPTVKVFGEIDIWFHKHIIHYFIFLILTGLPLFSESFRLLGYAFGIPATWFGAPLGSEEMLASGIVVARTIHRVVGVLLIITAIPYVIKKLLSIKTWAIWPHEKSFSEWWKNTASLVNVYIHRQHHPIGKFNNGQKLAAYVFIVLTLALVCTGLIMMFRDLVPDALVVYSRLIHVVSFVLVGLTLMAHVYFGTLDVNLPGVDAMFRSGRITLKHLKNHHPLLYEEMKEDGRLPKDA